MLSSSPCTFKFMAMDHNAFLEISCLFGCFAFSLRSLVVHPSFSLPPLDPWFNQLRIAHLSKNKMLAVCWMLDLQPN